MIVAWKFLSFLSLVSYAESECSSTSYYRDCWIRRFPGLHVDAEESQRRGAQLLHNYRGESAQNCSRACCLTTNFACNVAVFHYNTTQDSVNCFHLHCPTLQSCILHERANVIIYNVTKGMDPDLLIFGKPFPSNAQVLPHLASFNMSDLSGTDKRQFNRPHIEPSNLAHTTILATTTKPSTSMPTSSIIIATPSHLSVYSTQHNQDTLPASEIQQSTTLNRPSQLISTRIIGNSTTYPTIVSTTKSSPNRQTDSITQTKHTSSTRITPSRLSSQFTPSSASSSQQGPLRTTTAFTIRKTASTEFKTLSLTLPYLYISKTFSSRHTTTITPVPFSDTLHSTGETAAMSVSFTSTPGSTGESKRMPSPLKTPQSSLGVTRTLTVPVSSTLQRTTRKTTTTIFSFSRATESITEETTTVPVPLSSILQSSARNTPTLTVSLSSNLQRSTEETTTRPVPLSSIPRADKGQTETHTTLAPAQLSSASASITLTQTLTRFKITTAYGTLTTGPQLMSNSLTTTSLSNNQPIKDPQTSVASPMEKRMTPSSTPDRVSQEYNNNNLPNTVVSVTISPITSNRFSASVIVSEANSGLHTSPTTPTVLEDSQPYPNDTKGYISRNVTAGNSPRPVSDGGLMQVWHLAANTILIALATCAALACSCCCSVLMAASWRGRRSRKGRYQTLQKGKKGSMRLIKYVFIRESS